LRRNIPSINLNEKAKSSTPDVPIPQGHLRSAPKTIQEAMSRPDEWPFWVAAMCDENQQLINLGTWNKRNLPEGKNLLTGKWVFSYKLDEDGNIIRFKARWVVRGFSQIQGEDFDKTYSPVAKTTTIRLLIALAAIVGLYIFQFDITGAYLNALLEEDIYVELPHGFAENDKSGNPLVCKLVKSLYGLHQAAREWYKCLWAKYEEMGYSRNLSDACHFWQMKSSAHTDNVKIREHTTVHVDDILHFSPDPKGYEQFMADLNRTFKVGSHSAAKWILKMQLMKTNQGYFITNAQYAKEVLERLKLWDSNVKPARTPISSHYEHDKSLPLLDNKDATTFRSELMKLSYLATKTRPDLSYAVNILAQHQVEPRVCEQKALARLHRYLLGTWDYGLHYTRNNIITPIIHPDGVYEFASNEHIPMGYADADWANDPSRYSRTGYVVMFANAAICWQSTKQQALTCSSTEAELYALNELSREMKWMKNLMANVGIIAKTKPMILWQDNTSTQSIANDLLNDHRTKHMDVREKFVTLQIEQKQQELRNIDSQDQIADIFTKPLSFTPFQKHTLALGLTRQSDLTLVD
jgi:histone deacetylase 1/2